MNLLLPLAEPRHPSVATAIESLAATSGLAERGAVFTKSGVVDAILDLSGYTPDTELENQRLLEPSFGDGEFLLAAIDRLLARFKRSGGQWHRAADILANAIRGVELHRATFNGTSARVVDRLTTAGMKRADAEFLANRWLINDDFLLADIDGEFDFVLGNPPYVRQERIPGVLLGPTSGAMRPSTTGQTCTYSSTSGG